MAVEDKEIILLRFLQGYNSRTDKLVFVGVNKNGSYAIVNEFTPEEAKLLEGK